MSTSTSQTRPESSPPEAAHAASSHRSPGGPSEQPGAAWWGLVADSLRLNPTAMHGLAGSLQFIFHGTNGELRSHYVTLSDAGTQWGDGCCGLADSIFEAQESDLGAWLGNDGSSALEFTSEGDCELLREFFSRLGDATRSKSLLEARVAR